MASEDIIVRMGMDASDFNRGLQSSRKDAAAAASAMASLEKVIKDRALERMSVAEKINALRKEELELVNRAFAAESAGNKAAAANATLAALNVKAERERLITAEKARQVQLEKQLADETKRVADAAAKQASSEAKFRADLSERVRLERQAAQLRHAPRARESSGLLSGIGGAASSVAGALGIGIGLAAVVGWLERVSERMAGLRRQAEDLGASMKFMTGLSTLEKEFDAPAGSAAKAMTVLVEQVGKARTEGGEALEKFQQFGIELYDAQGKAKSGEEIFKAIATAIAGASDASTKAAMTFAFFGKSGREVNNILGMGGEALAAFVAAQGRSEAMLQAQAKNWEQIRSGAKGAAESAGDYASKLALGFRAFAAFGKGILTGDVRGQLAVMRGELKPDSQEAGTRAADEAANTEKQKRDKAELARTEKEQAAVAYERMTDAERLNHLDEEMMKHVARINQLKEGTVERAKEELEFTKKRAEWGKIVEKQEEEGRKALKERDRDFAAHNKQQAEAEKKAKEIRGERGTAVGEAEAARGDRLKFTLGELAGANLRNVSDPQLRKDIMAAREVARLESQAGFLKNRGGVGDLAEAAKRLSVADKVRAGISSIRDTERFPFANMDSNIASIDDTMDALLEKAKTDGLNVRAIMAP